MGSKLISLHLTSTKFHVRVGSMGEVWRLNNPEGSPLKRGDRVVCRTGRGVEIGVVVSAASESESAAGSILRLATTEDELLESRLARFKQDAVEECRRELQRHQSSATLLEVDHLFDGRTLIFHFLGEVDDQVQQITDSLVDAYEKRTRLKHFAKLLAEGCGPGCGTKESSGCGTSGGCAVCVVAAACKSTSVAE